MKLWRLANDPITMRLQDDQGILEKRLRNLLKKVEEQRGGGPS
jgi:hypothetical protein